MSNPTATGRRAAVIIDDPVRLDDGYRACKVRLLINGRHYRARIFPAASGEWLPYAKDDEVWLDTVGGVAGAGVHVVGYRGSHVEPADTANREIHCAADIRFKSTGGDVRAEADEDVDLVAGGVVRARTSTSAATEVVAMYAETKADLEALEAKVNEVIAALKAMDTHFSGAATAITTPSTIANTAGSYFTGPPPVTLLDVTVDGSKAAKNLEAEPG